MQEQEKQITQEEITQLENSAIESSISGDKPYRKKYRQGFTLVTCHDCGKSQNLILITEERKSSFKRAGHKKNRNRVPLLTPSGNKVYLDKECLVKRVKASKSK